jgi:N-acetylneuraminic acid mutarotase
MATFWSSSPNAVTHREFYKYDPATNIWSQVATFPGKARWLWANFALNNKFYVTLGKTFLGGPGYCKDTWEYDPSTDAWSLKDSFPGGFRDDATSFSINGMGCVVGGIISATAANEL